MTQQGTPRSNADATGMRLNLLDRAVVAGMALLGCVVGVVVGILAGLADSELIVTLAWLVPLGAVWVGRRMVAPKNCPLVGPIVGAYLGILGWYVLTTGYGGRGVEDVLGFLVMGALSTFLCTLAGTFMPR